MAHFYGTVQGNRGETSRCGSKSSGLVASANGWNIGGTIQVEYNDKLQTDVVYFYRNKGSSSRGHDTLIAAYAIIDDDWVCISTDMPELFI